VAAALPATETQTCNKVNNDINDWKQLGFVNIIPFLLPP
jgi:hypothetical protein